MLGQQDPPALAAIAEPVVVVWGATFLGSRPGGLWRCFAGGQRRRVRPSASTPDHYLYAVAALPDGVYLARSARMSRRHLSEFLLLVEKNRVRPAALEEAIRVWTAELAGRVDN